MLRSLPVSLVLGLIVLGGCGFEIPSPCPGMTAEEYSATRSVLRFQIEAMKASGVTKEEFLDEIDRISVQCDIYGQIVEGGGLPPIPASEACECMISLFREIAGEVW